MDSDKLKEVFAKRLKELREEKGRQLGIDLSQTKLAEELEVSKGSISFYEKGERIAGIDFLVKAAEYFDCSTDYLLGLSEWKNNKKVEFFEEQVGDIKQKLFSLNPKFRQTMLPFIDTLCEIGYVLNEDADEDDTLKDMVIEDILIYVDFLYECCESFACFAATNECDCSFYPEPDEINEIEVKRFSVFISSYEKLCQSHVEMKEMVASTFEFLKEMRELDKELNTDEED